MTESLKRSSRVTSVQTQSVNSLDWFLTGKAVSVVLNSGSSVSASCLQASSLTLGTYSFQHDQVRELCDGELLKSKWVAENRRVMILFESGEYVFKLVEDYIK